MSPFKPILVSCLFVPLASALVLSQQDTKKNTSAVKETEEKSNSGLRKIKTSRGSDMDVDIKIDVKALEANIEHAVEQAMRSVENELEALEINFEPIEINLN